MKPYSNILVILCLLFSGTLVHAQNNKQDFARSFTDSTFKHYRKLRKQNSGEQIINLKNGALLVMLHTKRVMLRTITDSGYTKAGEKIYAEQQTLNKALMHSFRNKFKFCPVYFFYVDDIEKVRNNNFESVLLDSNMVKDPSIKLKENYFLIAEYGDLYSESIGYPTDEKVLGAYEKGNIYKSNTIVIKTKYLLQLKKPFPYYQTCTDLRDLDDNVAKLSKKLKSFYRSSTEEN